MIDSTSVRAHHQAKTAKRGAITSPSITGELTTKIYVLIDAQGLPIRLSRRRASARRTNRLAPAITSARTIVLPDNPMMPRVREQIQDHGATPNIPSKSNRC